MAAARAESAKASAEPDRGRQPRRRHRRRRGAVAGCRSDARDRPALRCDDTELRAPNDGIILSRVRETGAIVAPADTVFVLSLTEPVWVRTYVAEPDLGRIHPGMKVEVTSDTRPNDAYDGTIGFISPVAEFTPKSVETPELRTDLVYRLRIVIDKPGPDLRQGMPVTLRFPSSQTARDNDCPEKPRDIAELVRLSDVTKRFGDAPPALDAVSGSIRGGEITGLVGPDGAGKTTLIRLMTGLMLPDSGTVDVLGFDTRQESGRNPGRHRLHAAALRALRRPVGAGKPRSLCRSARPAEGRAGGDLR